MRGGIWLWSMCLVLAVCSGCGKKADSDKPIEKIEAESKRMSAKRLEQSVHDYEEAMAGVNREIEDVKTRAKNLSAAELFGDEGKHLKDELSRLKQEMADLKARRLLYEEQLRNRQEGA